MATYRFANPLQVCNGEILCRPRLCAAVVLCIASGSPHKQLVHLLDVGELIIPPLSKVAIITIYRRVLALGVQDAPKYTAKGRLPEVSHRK